MPIGTKYDQWISVLLAFAREEGEITEVQAEAIREFIAAIITAVDGDFEPMTIFQVWAAYRKFEGAKKGEKLAPKAMKRLADLEVRVAAIELLKLPA